MGGSPAGQVRPREGGAVGVGRVGGGQRDGQRLALARVAGSGVAADGPVGEGAQPVDRAGGAELGGAQPVDEVPPTAATGVLEGREHLVDGREAARHPLADHRAAGHYAVPVEQPLGDGLGAPGRVGVGARQHRPAPRRLRRAAPRRGQPGPGAGGRAHPRRAHPGPRRWPPRAVAGGAGAGQGTQRGQRVVADPPGPHQLPQRRREGLVGGLDAGGAHGVGELAEEVGTAAGEGVEDRLPGLGVLGHLRLGQGQLGGVGQVQRDPAVGARQGAVPGPHHLARGRQLVEVRRLVVAHARGQHQRLERRGRHRAAGQLVDRRQHAVDAAQATATTPGPAPG